MSQHQLGVIGAGNMAEAILHGALAAGAIHHAAVIAADPDPARRELFTHALGVTCVADSAAPASCPHVLLAVKPQVMPEVLAHVAAAVRHDATVISIAAGVRTRAIHDALGRKGRIVRVMPNTPLLVGAGISALCPGPGAGEEDLAWAERLFAASGQTVRVDEPMMDVVTAVSGSGPAYFFYLIEAMIAAAEAEGMDPATAATLAVATCRGAAELLARTNQPPATLRAQVTSPGGTTQAAIETLQSAGTFETLVAAIRRAAARSRELGG